MSDRKDRNIAPSRIVSERGQTVIPKPIRDYMDLQPGDRVEWTVNEEGAVFVKAIKRKSILDFKGIVKATDQLDNLEEVIRQSRQDHYDRRTKRGQDNDA